MSVENQAEDVTGGGFVGRRHHKLRFTELDETFLARLILAKCPDPYATTGLTLQLTLRDLFRRFSEDELVALLEDQTISEAPKMSEIVGDFISMMVGHRVEAKENRQPALDYYHDHIRTRLGWLESGDPMDNFPPRIDSVTSRMRGKLEVFDIVVRPAVLRERLGAEIPRLLELRGQINDKMFTAPRRPQDLGGRIDYRKQVEFLTLFLNDRQQTTGEPTFSILSNQIPFRWALHYVVGTELAMAAAGTTTSEDKILLPLFLEVNGLLDVIDVDLESAPLAPHDVVVRYVLRIPAARNIFGASNAGLVARTRAQLNETELALYHRLHQKVREGLVFGGKPKLESSFGELGAWLIRKATYCLEEPAFLGQKARHWIKEHEDDTRIQIEDEFFLPEIYERLRNDFGARVVKKPERFGGEIDILFDDTIPIELKVRRNRKHPLDVADVDESYPPTGQAAVYAGVSRLGFVVVLDLPGDETQMVSLENCATVVERRFPEMAEFPTCITVIVFRCYNRRPSSSR